jgi:methionine-rich copper-binding protein CopC
MRRRGLVGLAVALGSITVLTGVAVAHTEVAETTPADNSTIETAPAEAYIRFGQAELPAPGQATDGRLEVYDACGTRVDKDDSAFNMQDSSITVSSEGAVAGRYEAHWFATAADGAAQAGVFDFEVTGGTPCKQVVREDPAEDVDLGFDVVKLQSKKVRAGSKVTATFAAPVTCKAFKDKDTLLTAAFDTNSDRVGDVIGTFGCKDGKPRLAFDDDTQTLKVTKPTATTLSVVVPRHVLLGDVDVYLESTTDKDECSDQICAEIAPDLGLLTVF